MEILYSNSYPSLASYIFNERTQPSVTHIFTTLQRFACHLIGLQILSVVLRADRHVKGSCQTLLAYSNLPCASVHQYTSPAL